MVPHPLPRGRGAGAAAQPSPALRHLVGQLSLLHGRCRDGREVPLGLRVCVSKGGRRGHRGEALRRLLAVSGSVFGSVHVRRPCCEKWTFETGGKCLVIHPGVDLDRADLRGCVACLLLSQKRSSAPKDATARSEDFNTLVASRMLCNVRTAACCS